MGVVAILVMWPISHKQIFVPPSHWGSIWNLALIGPAVLEKKTFENGGRRTDDGPWLYYKLTNEPKGSGELTKWPVHPAKTQISLGIHPVWSESSQCAVRVAKDSNCLQVDSKVSNQTGQLPRLRVFAGRTSFCRFCRVAAQMEFFTHFFPLWQHSLFCNLSCAWPFSLSHFLSVELTRRLVLNKGTVKYRMVCKFTLGNKNVTTGKPLHTIWPKHSCTNILNSRNAGV